MLIPKFHSIRRFLIVAFFLNLLIPNALGAPADSDNFALDWGSNAKASYTYVFSGLLTCQNRPCSNARVDLDLETGSQGVISQTTQADEDGRYQMEVKVEGVPTDSSSWKLEARTFNTIRQQSAESEGRIILMDGRRTVVVDRSLLLIQA
jgi:hypothetical protein